MRRKHILTYSLALIAFVVIVLALIPFPICRDWAFICENTGSYKGYREWRFGSRTNHWYEASPLDTFMQEHSTDEVSHRWTSYAGTGLNVFGEPVLRGHGQPGAIINFRHDIQQQWIEKSSEENVSQLYDLLVQDNQPEIDGKIRSIVEEVMQ